MVKTIEVTPQQLDTAAGKIEGLAGDYKTQYESLYKEADALGSGYEGEGKKTFINQLNGFKDDLEKMYGLMNQYADFLRKTAKTYRETQQNIVSQAKTLPNG